MDIRSYLRRSSKPKNGIDEEARRVLLALADLTSPDGQGVSATYLSSQLNIEPKRLLNLIGMLTEAEYVDVKKHGRVELVAPTLTGYEQARAWRKEKREESWFGRIPTPLKVFAGSLFAAMLGLLWWWLGLTPATSNLQPIGAATPIKVYDMGTEPAFYGEYWSRLPSAPAPDQVVAVKPGEDGDAYFERLQALYGYGAWVPVAFDGWVRFRFDVENVASRFQVNINSVVVEVESGSLKDPEDLLYSPPAGGGEVRDYVLDLSSHIAAEGDVREYRANLVSEGRTVDYVYLKPGERESIEIDVQLGVPGVYTLTPTVRFAFREESSVRRVAPYRVVYPQRYRPWALLYYESAPTWFSGAIQSGQEPMLATHNVIVDTQSGRVEVPKIAQSTRSCLPTTKRVAFESNMITYGERGRLFLIDTMGSDLRVLPGPEVWVRRHLEWTDKNTLLVIEPVFDERLQDYRQEMRLVDPINGKVSHVVTGSEPVLDLVLDDIWDDGIDRRVCLRDGTGCFVPGTYDDTNGDGSTDHRDASQVYFDGQGDLVRLGFSGEEQAYLDLSHDERMLAFVQGPFVGYPCLPTDTQAIYVMGTDGSELKKIVDEFGYYRNPTWSPDGRFLAFEAARPVDNGGQLKCSDSIFHIFVADLATGEETQLTSGQLSDHEPQWSSDGQWVLAGGERLTLSRWDGSCTQDVFVPPIGEIFNVLMEP